MDLVIRNIYLNIPVNDRMPEDSHDFHLAINVEIGERDKEGSELFHFVAASPRGLLNQVADREFKFLRGYILMEEFEWSVVRRSIQNLINHANSRNNWGEVVSFFNRYGVYDSEDLDAKHLP